MPSSTSYVRRSSSRYKSSDLLSASLNPLSESSRKPFSVIRKTAPLLPRSSSNKDARPVSSLSLGRTRLINPMAGFLSGKLSSGENHLRGTMIADQRRKPRQSDRRITSNMDFRRRKGTIFRPQDEVARGSQLATAAQTYTTNQGNSDLRQT